MKMNIAAQSIRDSICSEHFWWRNKWPPDNEFYFQNELSANTNQ